jgi:hypothetical protein
VKLPNLESSVFWDITPFKLLKVNQCFRGTLCLHLQGQRISQTRNQHEAVSKQSRLDSVIYQKIELFITTVVRTSNPTTPIQIS